MTDLTRRTLLASALTLGAAATLHPKLLEKASAASGKVRVGSWTEGMDSDPSLLSTYSKKN